MIKEIKARSGIFGIKESLRLDGLHFSESIALLQQLIKTPSFSGEEDKAADIVQAFLISYCIKTNRKGNNIWCYNKYYDPAKPTILLNSHLDTVKPNEGYTNDPFCPEIANGRLFGLGSNDAGGCRGALSATFLQVYSDQGLGFH